MSTRNLKDILSNFPRLRDRAEVFWGESLAPAAGGQVQVLIMSRRLGIFDQIQGVKGRIICSRHYTMLRPNDQRMVTKRQHGFNRQLRRAGQEEL